MGNRERESADGRGDESGCAGPRALKNILRDLRLEGRKLGRRTCRRGALIALLWRFRMPLEAPPGALSHFLLAGCLWFSTSSLLPWFWLLLAFARLLLPLLPLMSYTTWPLPLCVVIAPIFLAFISGLY